MNIKDEKYGYIILGKNTNLYHFGIIKDKYENKNKTLFCNMNMNLWGKCEDKKLYKITIKQDMKFLFCLTDIDITGCAGSIIFDDNVEKKMDLEKRLDFVNEIINDGYHGWFSTIEGGLCYLEICFCYDNYDDNLFLLMNAMN
jgi:hypothetical protein